MNFLTSNEKSRRRGFFSSTYDVAYLAFYKIQMTRPFLKTIPLCKIRVLLRHIHTVISLVNLTETKSSSNSSNCAKKKKKRNPFHPSKTES
uniref:Uncharacterized protein n=1 Tax=Ascaris lumbricoides TaxID=6252 RepID=A0A0M3I6H0_ASCLU